MCGKCSDESRDSILEIFCTDGLLTSLGTPPNFYYIYEKYFSIGYRDFANTMIFANTNGSIAGLPIKVPMAWECPGTPKRNLSGNGSVLGLPSGILLEMGVSRDSQKDFK